MTNKIENDAKPNFRKLAEQYAGFFTSLGGICITVLTLILALERDPKRPDLHSILVASLVVAILVSLIGAHLMAETAASIRTGDSPGARLFLLASVNIYIGAILTGFALMLLPAAYDKQNAGDIAWITLIAFLTVVVSACLWMYRYFASRIGPIGPERYENISLKPTRVCHACVIVVSLSVSYVTRKYGQAAEFIILILLSASSGFYFNRIYHKKAEQAAPADDCDWKGVSMFFYATITFSCITMSILGLRLIGPSCHVIRLLGR